MSQMMVWSINLFVLSIGILIAGMIKPKWIFFWVNNPTRLQIQLLVAALFMGGAYLYGEAGLEKQQRQEVAKAELKKVIKETPTIAPEVKK